MKNPIIVITGPTASGKSTLAVQLAKIFGGEIVNADSRTIYREMDITTDKPLFDMPLNNSKLEIENLKLYEGVPHHLFDVVTPDQSFSLADYKRLALGCIDDIHARGKIPFLVGGTGLYIDAVIYDFNLTETAPDPKTREKLEKMSQAELFEQLVQFDEISAKNIDKNNKRRLIRALEVVLSSDKSFYDSKSKKALPKNVLYLAIELPREEIIQKINKRVDSWIDQGLIEETKILSQKYSPDLPSMSSIGYAEISKALLGEITTEDALEKIKIRTRRYAKRQMTWFKKNKDIIWIKDIKDAENRINEFL